MTLYSEQILLGRKEKDEKEISEGFCIRTLNRIRGFVGVQFNSFPFEEDSKQ